MELISVLLYWQHLRTGTAYYEICKGYKNKSSFSSVKKFKFASLCLKRNSMSMPVVHRFLWNDLHADYNTGFINVVLCLPFYFVFSFCREPFQLLFKLTQSLLVL
jgi:hypothetical protein